MKLKYVLYIGIAMLLFAHPATAYTLNNTEPLNVYEDQAKQISQAFRAGGPGTLLEINGELMHYDHFMQLFYAGLPDSDWRKYPGYKVGPGSAKLSGGTSNDNSNEECEEDKPICREVRRSINTPWGVKWITITVCR